MLKKTLLTVRSAPVVDLVDMTVIIAMKMTVTLKKAMNFDMLVCLYVMLDTHHIHAVVGPGENCVRIRRSFGMEILEIIKFEVKIVSALEERAFPAARKRRQSSGSSKVSIKNNGRVSAKMDEFSENFQWGERVISNPKNCIANFP